LPREKHFFFYALPVCALHFTFYWLLLLPTGRLVLLCCWEGWRRGGRAVLFLARMA